MALIENPSGRKAIIGEAQNAGSELIKPKGLTVESALISEHQKDAIPLLQQRYDAACKILRGLSHREIEDRSCVVTANILYRFPDHPNLIAPRTFTHQIDDYGVPMPKAQSRTEVVYPNYTKFLIWWLKNLDGPIHDTVCVARPSRSTNYRVGPLATYTVEGRA